LIERLVETAREAGRAILEVYNKAEFDVTYKSDNSPLTEADKRSHEIIVEGITTLVPEIPLISEEGADIGYSVRREWRSFFLVDPLDGTKEFISRNGEFTVNIALLEEAIPVLGVIYVPVRGIAYYAERGRGAHVCNDGDTPRRIRVKGGLDGDGLVVAASRSHGSGALEDFLGKLDVKERISAGSSLKFCLVAEGAVDLYPRFGPTWEWDTAAGHAIVKEAGGDVFDTRGGRLLYNKEILKHSGFIVASADTLDRIRPFL
jgi:3'(2'), 5'-bisphosphate nucleotidase